MTLRKFEEGHVILSLSKEFILQNIDMGPFMTLYNIPLAIIFVVAANKYYNLSLRVINPNRQHVFKSHLMVLTHLLVMNCENLSSTQKIGINSNVQGVVFILRLNIVLVFTW